MQHQIKARASQEDVDDEKAEAVAGYIAADVEEMGVNGGACINPNSSMPTIDPPLPHPLKTLTISIYISRRYYDTRRSVGCGADDHGRSEYVLMTGS